MTIIRWIGRISLAEWIVLGVLVSLLWRNTRRTTPTSQHPGVSARIIDLCVLLTVLGIIGGAVWQLSWLSLVGFAAAALGIGLMVRGWGLSLTRWVAGIFGRR